MLTGIRIPTARDLAMVCMLLVGPTIFPQKINLSNDMFRKAVFSLLVIGRVLAWRSIYPFQPPTFFVSSQWEGLERCLKAESEVVMLRPIS